MTMRGVMRTRATAVWTPRSSTFSISDERSPVVVAQPPLRKVGRDFGLTGVSTVLV